MGMKFILKKRSNYWARQEIANLIKCESHISTSYKNATRQLHVLKRRGKHLSILIIVLLFSIFAGKRTQKEDKIQVRALRFIYASCENLLYLNLHCFAILKIQRQQTIVIEVFIILHSLQHI